MYTEFERFQWHPGKAARNAVKHGITFRTAAYAFDDPDAFVVEDAEHSAVEERFRLIGDSGGGILVVVFTERAERIRIISARTASRRGRRSYEEKRGV